MTSSRAAASDRPNSPPIVGEPKGKSWSAAEGLREVSTPLAALPSEIEFSADFPEPIHYDAERKLLSYRGQMYHSSYLYLFALSKDGPYERAIDQLFAKSVPPVASSATLPWGMISMVAAGALGILALVARMTQWI